MGKSENVLILKIYLAFARCIRDLVIVIDEKRAVTHRFKFGMWYSREREKER